MKISHVCRFEKAWLCLHGARIFGVMVYLPKIQGYSVVVLSASMIHIPKQAAFARPPLQSRTESIQYFSPTHWFLKQNQIDSSPSFGPRVTHLYVDQKHGRFGVTVHSAESESVLSWKCCACTAGSTQGPQSPCINCTYIHVYGARAHCLFIHTYLVYV